ncbi:dedicator of cytokinesis protein 9 isoform X3 [Centruroides vittatus]|uniref:dedicator of cytokinesis protein 9 isoform X3 n=1 Tax=Centruroides vittatus TaxID=120091 RepID=UPI0035105EC5
MAERKFTRGLNKPGSAAQVRETVSQAVRETTVWSKPQLIEPLDYETFIIKNKTIIQNDPQREMLLFPLDDVSQEIIPRTCRTKISTIPNGLEKQATSLFVRECIKTYTINWHVIKYKCDNYSGTFLQLARLPKSSDLQDQVYEIDTASGNKDIISSESSQSAIIKEGYVFKGPESGTDSFLSVATKSFKKRFMSLRKEIDGTHTLEFYKDESKLESKGSFSMDFCTKVVQNSKKNKWNFALQMGDNHRTCVLAVENEEELDGWISTLSEAISTDKQIIENNRKSQAEIEDIPSPSPTNYGTLKSLEHSKNPELVKYAHETDYSITEARKENRQNIFAIYPDMQVTLQPLSFEYEKPIEPPKEEFKMRIFIKFEELKFKLQAPTENDKEPISQIEPFFTTMTIYDAKEGRKVTEDFKFDINDPHIRQMLPNKIKNGENLNQIGNKGDCEKDPLFSLLDSVGKHWFSYPKQALFAIRNPHPDLYLVIRIEKVLQGGICHAAEPYIRHNDGRSGIKVQKLMKVCCQHLSRYRMPFAWAARPIFKPFTMELDVSTELGPIFRHDSSKLSEEDILKILSDFRKPDKLKHLTIIPGTIRISMRAQTDLISNTLTTSLVPVLPFPIPPESELTLELQEYLTDVPKESALFNSYINHLYIFPKNLKYDNQKLFTKARNIACSVEVRDSDESGAQPLQCIYGRPGELPLVSCAFTAVTHHSTCPDFYEEVKIRLPLYLQDKHHLLFTFYHVSCHLPKAAKKKEGPIETIIGYSWLPLLLKGRLNISEHVLPVSSHLPPGYLSFQPLGLGKGFSGPEIRWVENGKELFKVDLKLISTVYCKDQHLHNFFMLCQKLLEAKIPAPNTEINTSLKALHAVDMTIIINFLPTVLNQLIQLLVFTNSEDIALNTVRVLIHIVQGIHEAERGSILRSYLQYVFVAENLTQYNKGTTVHEKLAKYLAITLRPANTDFLVINSFLKHSWFFFQLLTKSMGQHLLASGRIKMHRHERFPADYQYRIQSLLQVMVSHIFQKYQEIPLETKHANQSLAHFIKRSFTYMDRGFVFKLINFYLEKYCSEDIQVLHEYKFEFLEIICSHEHFIALNLPILHRTIIRGHTKNIKDSNDDMADYEQEYWLSEQFCQHHFLIGILLQEIKASMMDPHIRKIAILVLCNLLAKHSFDDRYQGRSQQARVASLYLPLIPIIMDNTKLLDTGEIASPSMHKLNGVDELFSEVVPSTSSYVSTPVSKSNTLIAEPLILPTISGRTNRDSTYFTFISGQGLTNKPSINGSHGSLDSASSTPSTVSDRGQDYGVASKEKLDRFKVQYSGLGGHVRSQSFPFGSNVGLSRLDKIDSSEIKHLLVCFLYIIKNVNEELIIGWWQHCSESDVLNFFHILEICLHQFKYVGKKHIRNQNMKKSTSKAMTLPARTVPVWIPQQGNNTFSETHSISPTSESDNLYRALLEANMATEVGLIALDVLGLYCFHFKENLLQNDGDNIIMQKIFEIYLSFLQVGQSEILLKHLFASLRAFINKFPMALFKGGDLLCGKLCFELLRCCNSKLSTVRNEACALLYLLMRSNFEFTGRRSLTRVHLQLIVAVSQLLGDVVGLNSSQFQESLSIINNYSNSDKAMQHSAFPSQVKDLTKRIRTVLMATVQMKEHENDPEMFIDLQHQLANSYSATPALRKTWLESMARNHIKNADYSEAAHCYIHIAALQAEYLRQKGLFSSGCQAFKHISPNVEMDESNMKEDCGNQEIQYTEDSFLETLEQCVSLLDQAERYEIIPEIYKLINPIYERRRNYEALASSYKKLCSAYSKVVEVNKTGKRLLGRYYRVAFFGQAYFGEESGKEYIYKEPKVTSLVEMSERLNCLFSEKFGKDIVKMIMDSIQVNPRDLDAKYAYIQVTHVVPYFDEDELKNRICEFERNNNIRCFMFETPFTQDLNKPRGSPEEQMKRQTILKALYSFPYVKRRIPVFSKSIKVLSPIEVAIDEMQSRVKELQEVICSKPTDLKKLQLKLQGSISVQVNAGPLAYAKVFLDENKIRRYPVDKVLMLKNVYKLFIDVCQEALELNGKLIVSDQHEYHSVLKVNYQEMVSDLSNYLNSQILLEDLGTFRRTSLEVFNFISGSSTA